MKPADALYRALTGGRSRKSEQSFQAAMSELERQHGSKKAAAAAAGVADRTWRDWRAGTHKPSKSHRAGLTRAQRESRLSGAKERQLRGGGVVATVTGQIRCSSDSRNRSVNVDLPDDLAEQILNAYEAGNDAAMEAALQEAVDEAFGRSVELEDVSSVQLA